MKCYVVVIIQIIRMLKTLQYCISKYNIKDYHFLSQFRCSASVYWSFVWRYTYSKIDYNVFKILVYPCQFNHVSHSLELQQLSVWERQKLYSLCQWHSIIINKILGKVFISYNNLVVRIDVRNINLLKRGNQFVFIENLVLKGVPNKMSINSVFLNHKT